MSNLYPKDKAVLLFDGVCHTCNAVVDSILRSDKNDLCRFVSLQSDLGKSILESIGMDSTATMNTMVLLYQGKSYSHSSAYFELCRILKGVWSLGLVFSILPKSFTDACYLFYSKRRHAFGKRDACRMPTAEEKNKFLS